MVRSCHLIPLDKDRFARSRMFVVGGYMALFDPLAAQLRPSALYHLSDGKIVTG